MDRERARRILGLPEGVAPGEARARVAAAHARLRAHLAERGRSGELEALDRAAALLGFEEPAASWRRAALIGVVVLGALAGIAGLGRMTSERGGAELPRVEVADESLAPPLATLELDLAPAGATAVVVREGDVDQSMRVDERSAPLALEPGTWAVRASHADCAEDDQRSIDLLPGETQRVSLRPCSGTGWVVVRSNVEGDALSVDGMPAGSTGPERRALGRGEHLLRIEKAGYAPWQGAVEVLPGETLTLRADLLPAPAAGEAGGGSAAPAGQEGVEDEAAEAAQAVAAAEARSAGAEPRPIEPADRWTRQVRQFLLRYDYDLSGALDREDEIRAVPCDEWLGIEGSHDRSGLALSLTRFYGFDGSTWKGSVLGIDPGMRRVAYARMRDCGMR